MPTGGVSVFIGLPFWAVVVDGGLGGDAIPVEESIEATAAAVVGEPMSCLLLFFRTLSAASSPAPAPFPAAESAISTSESSPCFRLWPAPLPLIIWASKASSLSVSVLDLGFRSIPLVAGGGGCGCCDLAFAF